MQFHASRVQNVKSTRHRRSAVNCNLFELYVETEDRLSALIIDDLKRCIKHGIWMCGSWTSWRTVGGQRCRSERHAILTIRPSNYSGVALQVQVPKEETFLGTCASARWTKSWKSSAIVSKKAFGTGTSQATPKIIHEGNFWYY
jgi:hypothetical protein